MHLDDWQDNGPGWHRADAIVRRVQAPTFPRHEARVEDHGALADGVTDCSAAIAAAIDAVRRAGGGRVVLGAGTYLTGPIRLHSNIDLHVSAGATVRFIPEPERYLPPVLTRWQGVEMMGYSPLITAHDAVNVAVTGSGTLDGGADTEHWWPWCGLEEFGWHPGVVEQERDWQHLVELVHQGVPPAERVMAPARNFRPNFIEFYRCEGVWVQGVRIVRSPMWEIHPVLCTGVLVEDVHLDTHGPNNDGVDPESCTDVVIRGCRFDVGDDAIAIKAGREEDAERVDEPCRNVVIEDCTMTMKYGAFTIGSELTSGVRDVYVRRCTIGGPGLWYGLYIKTNAARGGYVENVYVDDVEASELQREFLSCNFLRGEGLRGPRTPTVRHIRITNVRVGRARRALHLAGFAHSPIADVHICDSTFESMAEPDSIENVVGLALTNVHPA
ncbi:glycoside hydrolase family 28 protein [Ruania halotolerans]|uniref:glycoside hydrolase family 28 protein n=1 Tax=Ruania halotolerans TaxID=2897773 RepID=UPI001E5CEE29|nr:glycoside hydrolase family 28 protein [Ruania halotolerans]UFU06201.1 glycoside hydrolase family 28 protein [Ruania halotolerans]